MKPASDPKAGKQAVDGYLAKLPAAHRKTLAAVRKAILAAAPQGSFEKLSWKMPSVCCPGALVCYAGFKAHCSLFPMDVAVLKAFLPQLGQYKTSKGTIQFPVDKPLSAGLVKAIVKARVAALAAKAKIKKR